jgi:hypothetical protein
VRPSLPLDLRCLQHRPTDCTRRSRKGDTLSMHYTVSRAVARVAACGC